MKDLIRDCLILIAIAVFVAINIIGADIKNAQAAAGDITPAFTVVTTQVVSGTTCLPKGMIRTRRTSTLNQLLICTYSSATSTYGRWKYITLTP